MNTYYIYIYIYICVMYVSYNMLYITLCIHNLINIHTYKT